MLAMGQAICAASCGCFAEEDVPRELTASVPVSPFAEEDVHGCPDCPKLRRTLSGGISVNAEYFPMTCVSVAAFMEFQSMTSYGQLLESGLLTHPPEGAPVHFVSHEWLSSVHPDPDSLQLRRLQDVFREILAGQSKRLFSTANWNTFSKGESRASQILDSAVVQSRSPTEEAFERDIKHGFIWLDWSSVPQTVDATRKSFEKQRQDQMAAVRSIPAYLERCNYLWVLAPTAIHADLQTVRNFSTYRSRAWCRLEEWGNLLSSNTMMPLVVTDSPSIATYSTLEFILDNAHKSERGPCSGQLSCCAFGHSVSICGENKVIPCDKIAIASVLEKLYAEKMRRLGTSVTGFNFNALEETIAMQGCTTDDLEAFTHKWCKEGQQECDEHGFTLLHIAVLNGNISLVQKMLDRRRKGDPWKVADFAGTPFQIAATTGSVAMAQLFFATGDIREEHINAYNPFGAAPLHMASENGRSEVLSLLLEHRAVIDLPKLPHSAYAGRTALFGAAIRSQFECCEILIRYGAFVNARDARGDTAIHMTALEPICLVGNQGESAKIKTVCLLLESRADPHALNDEGCMAVDLLRQAGCGDGDLWAAFCSRP
ncbi:unnamed protein product [Polarella glacialis]|uniref:Uncharacterized protein n=1 Tax=Polarella glacialis TaxID=89957 RepID=A0A813LAT6_POLGL|nr:unnamed protein product [Polarella glacialis]